MVVGVSRSNDAVGLQAARKLVFDIGVQDRLVFHRQRTVLALAHEILIVGPGEREQRLEGASIAFERLFAQTEDQRLLGRDALRFAVLAEGDRDLERPLDWRRNPLRSRPSRLTTIDRTEASSGGEAPGAAATGCFAACPKLARAWVMPTTPLASPSAWARGRRSRRAAVRYDLPCEQGRPRSGRLNLQRRSVRGSRHTLACAAR